MPSRLKSHSPRLSKSSLSSSESDLGLDLLEFNSLSETHHEFLQVPSKKRRLTHESFTEDDSLSGDALATRPLWDSIKSSYNYLMDEDIIQTCRSTQNGGDDSDQSGVTSHPGHLASNAPAFSLSELDQQHKELSEWLQQLQTRMRRRSVGYTCRAERYVDNNLHEDLVQRALRRDLFLEYARSLETRQPHLTHEIAPRRNSLEEQWTAVEKECRSTALLSDPKSALQDLTHDIRDLNDWLGAVLTEFPQAHHWKQQIARMSPRQLQEKQRLLTTRQQDIQAHSRIISTVHRLLVVLTDLSNQNRSHDSDINIEIDSTTEMSMDHSNGESKTTNESIKIDWDEVRARVNELRHLTTRLEHHCNEAWIHSLELIYCLEGVRSTVVKGPLLESLGGLESPVAVGATGGLHYPQTMSTPVSSLLYNNLPSVTASSPGELDTAHRYPDDIHTPLISITSAEPTSTPAPPLVAVCSTSWGQESGFESEISPAPGGGHLKGNQTNSDGLPKCSRRSGRRKSAGNRGDFEVPNHGPLSAVTSSSSRCSSAEGSLDILPFSELRISCGDEKDEYEKIHCVSSREDIFSCDDLSSLEGQTPYKLEPQTPIARKQPPIATMRPLELDASANGDHMATDDPDHVKASFDSRAEEAMDSDLMKIKRSLLLDDSLAQGFTAHESNTNDIMMPSRQNQQINEMNGSPPTTSIIGDGVGNMNTVSETDLTNCAADKLYTLEGPHSMDFALMSRGEIEEVKVKVSRSRCQLLATPKYSFYQMTAIDNEFDDSARPGDDEDKENQQQQNDDVPDKDEEAVESDQDGLQVSYNEMSRINSAMRMTTSLHSFYPSSSTASQSHASPLHSYSEERLFATIRGINDDLLHASPPTHTMTLGRRRRGQKRLVPPSASEDVNQESSEESGSSGGDYDEFQGIGSWGSSPDVLRRGCRSVSNIEAQDETPYWKQLANDIVVNSRIQLRARRSLPLRLSPTRHQQRNNNACLASDTSLTDSQPGSDLEEEVENVEVSQEMVADLPSPSTPSNLTPGTHAQLSVPHDVQGHDSPDLLKTTPSFKLNKRTHSRTDTELFSLDHNASVIEDNQTSYIHMAEKAEALLKRKMSEDLTPDSFANSAAEDNRPASTQDQLAEAEGENDDLLGWDNYQSPMYDPPSDYFEERLDLGWDDRLDAGMIDSSRVKRPSRDYGSSGNPSSFDNTSISPGKEISDRRFLGALLRFSRRRLDRCRLVVDREMPCSQGHLDVGAELEKLKALVATCQSNISQLKNINAVINNEENSMGGIAEADPIPSCDGESLVPELEEVNALLTEWTHLEAQVSARVGATQGLSEAQSQAAGIRKEVERVCHILDTTANGEIENFAELEKHTNALKLYESQLQSWVQEIESLSQNVHAVASAKSNILDVTNKNLTNIKLQAETVVEKNSKLLERFSQLSRSCRNVQDMCHECERVLAQEEHHLRCTKLAIELVAASDIDTVITDLKELTKNLVECDKRLDDARHIFNTVAHRFSSSQQESMDSQLSLLSKEAANLKKDCNQLVGHLKARKTANLSKTFKHVETLEGASSLAESSSTPNALFRRNLPYHLALILFIGLIVYFLLTDAFPNLIISPQLRYPNGTPM